MIVCSTQTLPSVHQIANPFDHSIQSSNSSRAALNQSLHKCIRSNVSNPSMIMSATKTTFLLVASFLLSLTAVHAYSLDSNDSRRAFFKKSLKALTTAVTATTASQLTGVSKPLAAFADDSLPTTGKKAPDFELPNSRGEGTTSLKTLIKDGKYTVLYFYPGAFTKGCTLEARNFQRDIDKYRSLGAQIVGVSVDPPEKNAQFCSSEGLDFFMLSDAGGEISKAYGSALSVPGFGTFSNRQTYLIDPDGNLRHVFTDVESRVPRHSAEVIQKLEEITGKSAPTVAYY